MSYGLVCDTLHAHRKAAKAGLEALGLWVLALSWCKAKSPGGFIPADRPELLCDDAEEAARAVAALVRARLWVAVDGGWRFHDWADHQRSAADDAQRKAEISAARAEAGRRGGLARASNAKQTKANEATPSKPKPEPKSEPKPEDPEHTHTADAREAGPASPIPFPPPTLPSRPDPPVELQQPPSSAPPAPPAPASSEDPRVVALLQALQLAPAILAAAERSPAGSIPALRTLAADVLLGRIDAAGIPLSDAARAIGEAGADLAADVGTSWPAAAKKIRAYVDRARASEQGARSPPRRGNGGRGGGREPQGVEDADEITKELGW